METRGFAASAPPFLTQILISYLTLQTNETNIYIHAAQNSNGTEFGSTLIKCGGPLIVSIIKHLKLRVDGRLTEVIWPLLFRMTKAANLA
jgi:hypothetical protein